MKQATTFLAVCLCLSAAAQNAKPGNALISSYSSYVIGTPPDSLKLDTSFYKKYTDAYGIPVVSSTNVSDEAVLVARDIVNYMLLKRPDIRSVLIRRGARLSIIGKDEMQTDLPECRDWKKPTKDDRRLTNGERENYDKPGGIASMTDRQYWNQRARGMGGIKTSCAEENLLGIPGTRYFGENITVHEFSHNIMGSLTSIDTAFRSSLRKAYENAKSKGMYKNQYAINTIDEYWAEGTQWWFWSNFEFMDGTTRLQSPDDLKQYDPALYALLEQVYPGHHIPMDVYHGRNLNSPARRKQN